MSEIEKKPLSDIVRDWLVEWGIPKERRDSVPYREIPKSELIDALSSLIQTCLEFGYTPKQIHSDSMEMLLIKRLTFEGHDPRRLKKWRQKLIEKWDFQCESAFSKPEETADAGKREEFAPQTPKIEREHVSDSDRMPVNTYKIDEEEDILAGIGDVDVSK